MGGFLASELASHGTVAEGDQLHPLLTEVREIVSSTPYQIALGDLLQASHVVVAEQLEAAWAATYVPWAAFAVAGLLVAGLLSAKLWGVGKGMAVLMLILSCLAGGGAYYGAQGLLGVFDRGSDQMEQREERLSL